MAETQKASVGYMGQVWLHNGVALYELVQVKEFDVPDPGEREEVEDTHLKSPDWMRTYISTFFEGKKFDVMLNFRPLSDTAVLLDDARADGDVRAMKVVLPQNGIPFSQIELTVKCLNVTRPQVTIDGIMESTATFRIVTIDAIEAYVA